MKVTLNYRLFAFCIDLTLVVAFKIFFVQGIAGSLNSILMSYGKHSNPVHWNNELTFFVFSLFPIFWISYQTLCFYIWGTTMGTKAMNYHIQEKTKDGLKNLSLLKSFQRALLLTSCLFSFGIVAMLTMLRKDKKVFTDLVDNVVALKIGKPAAKVLLLTHKKSENKDHQDAA